MAKALAELGTALEELRVAQEQLLESRSRADKLAAELRSQSEKYWALFDDMPEAYVVTKPDTTILEVNKAAAQVFNVSQRFLIGKLLSVFVCEDRTHVLAASVQATSDGAPRELLLKLRPRERAPMPVIARVTGNADAVRWILRVSISSSKDTSSL